MHKAERRTTINGIAPPRRRSNRKRRSWHRPIRNACCAIAAVELLVFLFAGPAFRIDKLRIEGVQTLTTQQVFAEARVGTHCNLLLAAIHAPFTRRLAKDPVIDRVTRSVILPHTLVIHVTERQRYVTLFADGKFWLVDRTGVPYRNVESRVPGVPVLEFEGAIAPNTIQLGQVIKADWFQQAYKLMALLPDKNNLRATTIKVDQNANLCLNRDDNLQINIGQPDKLSEKLALAQATLSAAGNDAGQRIAYIDVSSPNQPALMPRVASKN